MSVFESKDVWDFSECTVPFTKPILLFCNLLFHYTKEGDLIFDPMAYDGIMSFACELMNRRCVCRDLTPAADFIEEADIFKAPFPKDVKLIWLHFVYNFSNNPEYIYSGKEGDMTDMKLEQVLEKIPALAQKCHAELPDDAVVAIMAVNQRRNKRLVDFGLQVRDIFIKNGFKDFDRVIATKAYLGTIKRDIGAARKHSCMTAYFTDIFLLRKQSLAK